MKFNRLSLAVLALLSSFPAAAEESPSSPWSLGWQDGFAVDSAAGKRAAETDQKATESEPAAEAKDSAGNKDAVESKASASQDPTASDAAAESRDAAGSNTPVTASQDQAGSGSAAAAGQGGIWQRIRNGFKIDEAASRNPLV